MPEDLLLLPSSPFCASGRADISEATRPATLPGGFLHVRGIPDWGPWNDGGIEYTHESFVDAILRPGTADRKVRTPEELQAAMAEPRGPAPSRTHWLHVSLLEEACRLLEMMSAELTSPQSPDH